MSRHHDQLYLHHIDQAVTKILRWMRGVSWDEFMDDDLKQSAVIRQLEIAGEAAAHLSDPFRMSDPTIDARQMKALRNVLIHGYASVDLEVVWNIVQNDLPPLHQQLETLVRKAEEERE